MHRDRTQGHWKQATGKVKTHWGALSDDDLDVVAGRHEHRADLIHERYGLAKNDVEKQLAAWEREAGDAGFKPE